MEKNKSSLKGAKKLRWNLKNKIKIERSNIIIVIT